MGVGGRDLEASLQCGLSPGLGQTADLPNTGLPLLTKIKVRSSQTLRPNLGDVVVLDRSVVGRQCRRDGARWKGNRKHNILDRLLVVVSRKNLHDQQRISRVSSISVRQ